MLNLLLLNDNYDETNWGSQACSQGLRSILLETVPGVRISSFSAAWVARKYRRLHWLLGGKVTARKHSWVQRLSRPVRSIPRIVDEFESIAKEWLRGEVTPDVKEWLEVAQGSDIIVFNGEGSTYRNNFSAIKPLFMLWFAKVYLGKPAVFLNGSVTLTQVDPILPGMIKEVFDVVDGIAVREPWSRRCVEEFIPGAGVEVVPDSVFYFCKGRERNGKRPKRVGEYFCVSPSMLPMDYGRGGGESTVVKTIRELKNVVPSSVLMARDPEDQYLEKVAKETNSEFIGPEYSYEEVLEVLSNAAFLVSGRYHHIIMATIVGCPSIPLSTTSHKIHGLCELLNGEIGAPLDATNLGRYSPAIREVARSYLEIGASKRESLLELSEELRKRVFEMGEMVARLTNARNLGKTETGKREKAAGSEMQVAGV